MICKGIISHKMLLQKKTNNDIIGHKDIFIVFVFKFMFKDIHNSRKGGDLFGKQL